MAEFTVLKDAQDMTFLLTPLQINLQVRDQLKMIGSTDCVMQVFVCHECDDTHLQIQFGPEGNQTILSILLHPKAAEYLANNLNSPQPVQKGVRAIPEN